MGKISDGFNMFTTAFFLVGEEDEVSIRDVAHMVAEAMEFKGELIVSYNITQCNICVLFSIIHIIEITMQPSCQSLH